MTENQKRKNEIIIERVIERVLAGYPGNIYDISYEYCNHLRVRACNSLPRNTTWVYKILNLKKNDLIASVIEHPRPRCGTGEVNAFNARTDFLISKGWDWWDFEAEQKAKENARREIRERIASITKKEIEDYLHKKTTNHES